MMKNDHPVQVRAIRSSLACFALGWFALLPGVGVAFAVLAWWQSIRAKAYERQAWNPARLYRVWGVCLAVVGILTTLVGCTLFGIAYYNSLY